MMFFAATIRRRTKNQNSYGANKGLAALTLALVGAAFGNAQVNTNPIATYNSLSTATLCNLPYSSMWHGSFVSTATGGLVTYNPSLGSTSLKILNTQSLDFTPAGAVAVDVTNPTAKDATFLFIIHDSQGGFIQNSFTVPANRSQSVALILAPTTTPSKYGVLAIPTPYPGFVSLPGCPGQSAKLNLITDVMIAPFGNSPASSLLLSNIRLLQGFSWDTLMTGCIDAYGQSAITNWAGKLTSSSQFATRRSAEESSFKNLLGSTVDAYGGSLSLPAQTATGHFRTQQINGKWWLVTPLGHLFFMDGVDEIRPTAGATTTSNRGSMFQSLPAKSDPLAVNYGTSGSLTTYNFYTANLQRKYGTNWSPNWVNTAISRLQSWGLNTIGSFADDSVIATGKLPYIYKTDVTGSFKTVSTGSDLWGPMPDPFDPAFATAAATLASSTASQANSDPYMIGIVVGNELSWTGSTNSTNDQYALALGTLKLTASNSPAKSAFVSSLQQEYSTIASLNSAWGTTYKAWSDLNGSLTFGTSYSGAFQNDMMHWVGTYAYKYYNVINKALKNVMPNTLYFGNSYSVTHMTPQVLWEAHYCVDVLAFNMYGATMNPAVTADTAGINMPMVMTEFNFTSITDGLWGSFVLVPDESSRAAAYTSYVNMVATNPLFVGCNFYLYADQATSGAIPTGQNNTQGVVDVTDTPYAPLVAAMQAVALSLYQTRWNF